MFSKIKLQMSEIWMLKAVKTWTVFFIHLVCKYQMGSVVFMLLTSKHTHKQFLFISMMIRMNLFESLLCVFA